MSQADRTAELWGIDQFEAFVVGPMLSQSVAASALPRTIPRNLLFPHIEASSSPYALSPHGVPFCYRRQPSQRV